GLPVICTDSGGITDFTSHLENAYVCRYHDSESLVLGISEMLDNHELRNRLRKGGLKTAALRSWDSINNELISQYELVLEKLVRQKRLAG
ncbi:MAG: glycosyltransferase, partial [Oscillospiraceae bacterium]|nr:glycosyltransferase [Oscillospiraceae bacterium]